MKRNILWVLAACALLAGVVWAQESTRLVAQIPFAFVARETTFEAGHYEVDPTLGLGSSVASVSNDSMSEHALFLTMPIEQSKIQTQAKLVFHRYGDKYFLSEIWVPGTAVGRIVPMGKTEKELAKTYSPKQVALLANFAR